MQTFNVWHEAVCMSVFPSSAFTRFRKCEKWHHFFVVLS